MTNKLLTLEEIEEIEKGVGKHYMTVKADVAFDLLTTARAYWELKEPAEAPVETVSYRGLGSDEYDQNQRALKEAFEKGRAMAEQEMKDKPHARTIEAVIEALEAGTEFEGAIGDDRLVFNPIEARKPLESILKKL